MPANTWSQEEQQTLTQLENYFRHTEMSLYDKIFNALIIAEHELSGHCFTNENERRKIESFQHILNALLLKISVAEMR